MLHPRHHEQFALAFRLDPDDASAQLRHEARLMEGGRCLLASSADAPGHVLAYLKACRIMALDLNPFIEKRTKALATVALTRRRDLELIWLNEDEAGLDLIVNVARDDVPGQHHFIKSFGVILKG